MKKGSAKLYLHKIAVEIYDITSTNDVHLNVSWVPRELNTTADVLSKYVDVDDWEISTELFQTLNKLWGPLTMDRFGNSGNKKLDRIYNSSNWVAKT